MGETLDALRRLQDVEIQLAAIRQKREARTRRIEGQEHQVNQANQKLEAHRRKIRERQMKLDALTLDVTAREESINSHREALNKAKTNKEYSAILAAMNTEKADCAKLESGILELMEEIQKLQDEAAEIEAERAKFLDKIAVAKEALEALDAQCRDERTQLEARRGDCSANIAPATLSSFMRVADHNDGEAMAAVTKFHPKREEYMCEGCNMKVTLEVVNALQSKDQIQICSCCGRILYLESTLSKGRVGKA